MLFDGFTAVSLVWDDCDGERRKQDKYVHKASYWISSDSAEYSLRHSLLLLIFMGLEAKKLAFIKG